MTNDECGISNLDDDLSQTTKRIATVPCTGIDEKKSKLKIHSTRKIQRKWPTTCLNDTTIVMHMYGDGRAGRHGPSATMDTTVIDMSQH